MFEQFFLTNKTAIITGGEGLIGKIACKAVRDLGGQAISVDISPDATIIADVSVYSAMLTLSEIPCDILINCAIGNQKPVETPAANWNRDIEIGLNGTLNAIQCCGDQLRKRRGVILNMGSDLSLIAPDNSLYDGHFVKPISYSVVKHGIVGLTRYFAVLWPEVRCNCLCPGGIEQGQKIPKNILGRNMRPEEIAGPIAFLISNASSFMTGSILTVDGGRTCL